MSLELPNPGRLLLFGKDADLLESRALVLRSAGMIVDIAVDIDEFKIRIAAPGFAYDVIVCCYTATKADCSEISTLSNRTRTSVMILEHFLLPSELIGQVSNLIGDGRSRVDGACEADRDRTFPKGRPV